MAQVWVAPAVIDAHAEAPSGSGALAAGAATARAVLGAARHRRRGAAGVAATPERLYDAVEGSVLAMDMYAFHRA